MANPTAAVTVDIALSVKAYETLGTGVIASTANQAKITHEMSDTQNLTGSTPVPVSKVVAFTQALSAGAATIDLTSLVGANGKALNATGLKLQVLVLKPTSTNTGAFTVTEGGTNGYAFLGAAWKVAVTAGASAWFFAAEDAPDVGASDLAIDCSGTGTESCDILMVFG